MSQFKDVGREEQKSIAGIYKKTTDFLVNRLSSWMVALRGNELREGLEDRTST